MDDLRARQDLGDMSEKQDVLGALSASQFSKLDQMSRKQDDEHAGLLARTHHISSTMNDNHASSTHQHEAVVFGFRRQSGTIKRSVRGIHSENQHIMKNQQQSRKQITDMQFQAENDRKDFSQSLRQIATDVTAIHTTTSFTASTVNMVTKVVREEVRSTLKPVLEQALGAIDSRHDDLMQRLEETVAHITQDIGQNAHSPRVD